MGMSEELRALIHDIAREVELAKDEVRDARRAADEAKWEARNAKDQARFEQDMSTLFSGGPESGPCPNCGRKLRARWKHCPRCGLPTGTSCLFCHDFLPNVRDLKFCPSCGNRVN